MPITLELHFTIEDDHGAERPVEVCVRYTPARPAPRCSNPDRAAFADPGDGSECDVLWARYAPADPKKPAQPLEDSVRHGGSFLEHVAEAADETWEKKDF